MARNRASDLLHSKKVRDYLILQLDRAIPALDKIGQAIAELEVRVRILEQRNEASIINAARVEDRLTVLEHAQEEAHNKGRTVQPIK